MIRVLAFVLSICCCIGLLTGTYCAMTEQENLVSFTETVKYGDPAVLDGRVLRFGIHCGDHMMWDTEYRFGPEDSHSTAFRFSQNALFMPRLQQSSPLQVYAHSGWSASGFDLLPGVGDNGYRKMFQTVAAMTNPGEEGQMNLKLKDFVDYHALNFDLNYTSERYFCIEYVDQLYVITEDSYYGDAASFEKFSNLFRFPVQEDQIISITVELDQQGHIRSMGYNDEGNSHISIVNAATDAGLWCIPVYLSDWDDPQAIPGEYAQGMGIYFIPWKETGTGTRDSKTVITLDVDRAENIYPLPETSVIYDLVVNDDGTTAWLLSLENEMYVMTKLDLQTNRVLSRLELMERNPESQDNSPTLRWRNGLYLVIQENRLALVADGETPSVEFVTEKGALSDGFYYFEQDTGTMLYEDGILYIADHPHYNEKIIIMVFDASGPVYWGEYVSSLYECNDPGANPNLWPVYRITELE